MWLLILLMLNQPFKTTPVFDWTCQSKCPVVINQGGTWSSKTVSICQTAIIKAVLNPGAAFNIVGQDIPNLKRGAMKDMGDIINDPDTDDWVRAFMGKFNVQDKIYHCGNRSLVQFASYEDEQDAKSGKFQYLFLNEADGIPWPVAKMLMAKTSVQTFIDYNPTAEFWAHTEFIHNPAMVKGVDFDLFISNWTHNPYVPDKIKQNILTARETDPEWFKVYGLGKTGKLEGLVFPSLQRVEWPENPERVWYGLDFGYTNDPTTLVRATIQDNTLIFDELIYERGLTNPAIGDRLASLGITKSDLIYADAAEPKSIDELRALGWNIQPAEKGSDSIAHGIQIIKSQPYAVTPTSPNGWKESRMYAYGTDKLTGKPTNKPIDAWNHFWDAARYAMSWKLKPEMSFVVV